MRVIDADRLLMHLSDYALQESPWWGANGYGNKDAYEAIAECIKAVEEAPTVDAVEVVHGEWNQIEIIDDDSGDGVNDDASQCSVCGDVFDSYYWAKTYFNYCPNCGAKMEGGEADG